MQHIEVVCREKSEAAWEMSGLVFSMLKEQRFFRKDPEPAYAGTAGVSKMDLGLDI